MTLSEFLLARIAEDEANAGTSHAVICARTDPCYETPPRDPDDALCDCRQRRVLAECKAKRAIVELLQSWPVLVDTPPTFEDLEDRDDLTSKVIRMSRHIAWLTEREYRAKFGDEPPPGPVARALAAVYADHPDYDPTWASQ